MDLDRIKKLIEAKQWQQLCKEFTSMDIQSNTINKWQLIWDLPLEPHGCNLAQRLRSKLANFDLYYNGVPHLNRKAFPSIATEMTAPEILILVDQIKEIAPGLREVYKKISSVLYD